MSDWNACTLGEIADIKGGKRLPAGADFAGFKTAYPYLRVVDMVDGTINKSNLEYVTDEIQKSIKNYTISKYDLYITIAGTIGLCGLIPNQLDGAQLTENAAKITNISPSINIKFLCYYLNSEEFQLQVIKEKGTGGGVPKLALFRIAKLYIQFPKEKVQRKIAKILTTVDNLIEKTQTLIDKYQSIKQGMMHDLFTRGVDQNGKLRPTYEEAPHLYKESELGWIPKEWEIRRLGNFTCVKGGKRLPAGSDFANEKTEYPYLRVTDMVNGTIKDGDIKHVSAEIQKSISRYTISSDDLYVTIAGTIGLFGTIPLKYDGAQLTENAAKITSIDPNKYDLLYLSALLNSKIISSQVLKEIGLGAGVPKLALFRIEKLLLPIPTLNEQKRNRLRLQKIINTIEIEGKKLEKLKSLKNGLMQDLLTGKVRVKTDEVEEEVS